MNITGSLIGGAYGARRTLARVLGPGPGRPNEYADRLAEDGVVVLPELLPKELIDRVGEDAASTFVFERAPELIYSPDLIAVREANGLSREEFGRFYGLHIKNFQRRFDVNRHVVPLIAPIMNRYYGSRFYVREVHCYRTQPIPRISGSYKWHTDNYPLGSSRAIVYLNDVETIENGPLTVALGSHAGYRPELGRIGARFEDADVRTRFKVMPCLGKKGTVILFDNNSIHRATDPARGHRDVINFIMFPSILPGRGAPRGSDLTAGPAWLRKFTR